MSLYNKKLQEEKNELEKELKEIKNKYDIDKN